MTVVNQWLRKEIRSGRAERASGGSRSGRCPSQHPPPTTQHPIQTCG